MKNIALLVTALLTSATANAQTSQLELATEIHDSVNHAVKYKDDRMAGKSYYDSWDIPEGYGDCEDIALLKKIRLIEAGFSPEDVKLLIVTRTVDQSKSNKKVIFLHVVNYIPSLNVILDNSLSLAAGTSSRRKKVPVVTYDTWMKNNGASLLCEVVDERLGDNISLDQRCGRSVIASLSAN